MSGKRNNPHSLKLDRIIHEPARLQIISYLAGDARAVPFSELNEKLGLSAGNLSVQLKRLEDVGYVSIVKSFRDNRPLTAVTLTRSGFDALQVYLQQLESIINQLKETIPAGEKDKN